MTATHKRWEPKWPFRSSEAVVAHEHVYLLGYWKPGKGSQIHICQQSDLQIERWLEQGGTILLQEQQAPEAIRNVYIWKMRATLKAADKCSDPPTELLGKSFAAALRRCSEVATEEALEDCIDALTRFPGVGLRLASAFLYWLRPNEFQVIDRRSTEALDLSFEPSDYTVSNYLWWCEYARDRAATLCMSLRTIDRALFTYHKLLEKGHVLPMK